MAFLRAKFPFFTINNNNTKQQMQKTSPKVNDAVGVLILGLLIFFAVPALLAYMYPQDYGAGLKTRELLSGLSQLVGILSILLSVATVCFRFVKSKINRHRR
jgi:hypothetical protein